MPAKLIHAGARAGRASAGGEGCGLGRFGSCLVALYLPALVTSRQKDVEALVGTRGVIQAWFHPRASDAPDFARMCR